MTGTFLVRKTPPFGGHFDAENDQFYQDRLGTKHRKSCVKKAAFSAGPARARELSLLVSRVPAPGNIYATPLRFKLSGHPVLSARFNVETAGSERKRPEI